jgi:MFS family permease
MELSKKSFFCKVAYLVTEDDKIPAQTSLCKLSWRFVLNLFIVLPIVCVVVALLWTCAFLFARRLTFCEGDSKKDLFTPYKRWPKVGGYRIWPLWFFWAFFLYLFPGGMVPATAIVGCIVVFIILFAFACMGYDRLKERLPSQRQKEPSVFMEYIRAKKQKVCPIVSIKD